MIQQAHTRLTGRGAHRDLTLALGFAQVASQARAVAEDTLEQGWDVTAAAYRDGWTTYRNTLFPIPAAALPVTAAYETSLYTLKAHEDKGNPGAFVASPSRPWGQTPYHRVRARDLYHVATALLAAGDKVGANRALDFLLEQQDDDGLFPAYTRVDGKGDGEATAQGLPIVLVHQLGRENWSRVRRAADALLDRAPDDPATLAADVAGLICAADIARRNDDATRAARYERVADARQRRKLQAGRQGPRLPGARPARRPQTGRPGDRQGAADGGPPAQRGRVLAAVRRRRLRRAPGRQLLPPGHRRHPRPGLAAARAASAGEYELRAGRPANAFLQTLAGAGNDGLMLPEQVWDGAAPTGKSGFKAGQGTFSATPLAWTHAQLIRLAWSIEARTPVELPQLVVSRYG